MSRIEKGTGKKKQVIALEAFQPDSLYIAIPFKS